MSLIDHGAKPFHIRHGSQLQIAICIGKNVVGDDVSADCAMAIHIIMFGNGGSVFIRIGQFA